VTLVAAAGEASADEEVSGAVEAALRSGETQLEDGAPVAALPLLADGRVIGAIGLSRRQHVDGIAAADLALLEDLADRAALALENARLYEYEHEVAHTLQRSMLAGDPPHHPRCAIGVHYSPAEATLEVGGDWYDAFFLGEDRVALVVGDVVGRGLQAATTMGQLRSAVRALAGAQLGPAGVLENLDAFAERAIDARGATVVYAELDLRDGRLAYACAGHPPPVLAAPGRPPELLWGGRSTPLGAFTGGAPREQKEMEMERGSRLLLYTDGLVERRDRSLDEGFARLSAAFGDAHATPVGDLGALLSGEMLSGVTYADDVCLLAVAFGSAQPFEHELPAEAGRLKSLRTELSAWLEARGVSGSDHDAVVIACSEMAANAIEHGYRGSAGSVCVLADTAPGEVTVAVRDRGAWRMPSAGRAGRGRGLKIVESMMDDVVMDRGHGTRVTMRRRLREPRE
jgi:serine/threonine-protein kinase RsbW